MVRNIKLTIEYDGTNYSGWQVQDGRHKGTIQGVLEHAASRLLQEKVKVVGSGRTDAGVHAAAQVANFKTKSKFSCLNIQKGLNGILPKDMRIKQAEDVCLDFHARFCARSKLYRYTIINHSFASPFLRRYSHLVRFTLDLKKMRQACCCLLGRHNLRSFQAVDKRERSSIRTIKRLNIRKDRHLIYLDIEADGFLYHMVRNIVGTLIEVGRGKLKAQEIKGILGAKNRIYAGPCAPAKGLCLMQVKYQENRSAMTF